MNVLFAALASIFSFQTQRTRRSREYCLRMAQLSEGSPVPVGIVRVLGTDLIPRILSPVSAEERQALEEMSHTFFAVDQRASTGRFLSAQIVDAAASALQTYLKIIDDPRAETDPCRLVRRYIDECRNPAAFPDL